MYSWKERLIDWANQKGAWTHILVAVGIALLITAIILGAAMPGKGVVNTNAVDIGEAQDDIEGIIDMMGTKVSQADLDSLSQGFDKKFNSQTLQISSLGNRMGNAETSITENAAGIVALNNSLAEVTASPPEAYLTGVFGNYTLYAESSEAGNFMANVHLAYSAPVYVGNATAYDETLSAFYAGVNWTVNATVPAYVLVVAFNGTAWGISQVWWNIGTFELLANNETAIDITCAGLNSTWEPDFVYAEVYPVLPS